MFFSINTIHEGSRYRIKDREKALIFQSLCTSDNNTRKMIIDNLELRPITVSRIVKELIEDGLVREGDSKDRNSKGRPEIHLFPVYSRFVAISIHVLSRVIKGSLVNLNGDILETQSVLVPEESGNTEIIYEIRNILRLLTLKLPEKSQLIGIGSSLPGTVNVAQSTWVSSARWPNLSNICFKEQLKGFEVPLNISRSLDPELEYLLFKNEKYRNGGTLLFHWGYGIGSAFALDGKILKSSIGRFGEIGHWQVTGESGKKCRCGSTGCLETEAALWAILPEIRAIYPEAPEDEPGFSDFLLNRNVEDLVVIKRALSYITPALANLYKVFYPDRILVLGPFVENSSIIIQLKREFRTLIPEYARSSVEFDVIPRFQGAVHGSTYHLFREALKPLLRTRGNL